MKLIVNSELSLKEAQIELAREWKLKKFLVVNIEKQQRTLTQNKAMHLYFSMLAYELNISGFDLKKTLRKDFEILWTETSIKELIWKPVQQNMFDSDSTTKLTTDQVSQVYDVIRNHILEITIGEVDVLFPDKENM